MNVVPLSATFVQDKGFSEHHGWCLIYWQFSTHEHQDAVAHCRLTIDLGDIMSDLTNASKFFVNCLLSHKLLAFEGKHGLTREKVHESLFWLTKLGVVVLHKLFSNVFELCHG